MLQLGTFLLGSDLCTVPKIYLLLPLYINRFITKKFPIEILLQRIDSRVKNFREDEYNKQNGLQHLTTSLNPSLTTSCKPWESMENPLEPP